VAAFDSSGRRNILAALVLTQGTGAGISDLQVAITELNHIQQIEYYVQCVLQLLQAHLR
jgi:hypothetical protein